MNSLKTLFGIIALILICTPFSVRAEYYKYVDHDGTTHFTDDLSKVPNEFRPTVVEVDDIISPQSKPKPALEGDQQDTQTKDSTTTRIISGDERPDHKSSVDSTNAMASEEVLRNEGKELDLEYEMLTEERERLEEEIKESSLPSHRAPLLRKTNDINARIIDYMKRKEAFNKRVEQYNTSIQQEQQQLTSPKNEPSKPAKDDSTIEYVN